MKSLFGEVVLAFRSFVWVNNLFKLLEAGATFAAGLLGACFDLLLLVLIVFCLSRAAKTAFLPP